MQEKERDILFKIKHLGKMLKVEFDAKLESIGLTSQQGRILHIINKNQDQNISTNQRDIEEKFHLSKSTVSGLIKRLENKELITITNIGKNKYLLVTDKAKELKEKFEKLREEIKNKLLDGVNLNDLDELNSLLDKLTENMEVSLYVAKN